MNVHLAIPDLVRPNWDTADDTERLAALEQLYAKGRRTRARATNLTAWLVDAWGAEGGHAAYALAADGGEPAAANWARADPCHLRLERDRLVVVDATMFDISRDEAEAFAATLNRHFADRRLVFCPLHPERWYLRSPESLDVEAAALVVARGKAVPPRERGAAGRHALANELQMLLHDHPVNQAREGRGALPINAAWLWGGGRFVAPAARPFRRVRAHDAVALGLARASGAAVLPLPDSGREWLRASAHEGVELVLLDALSAPASYEDWRTWRERLSALERLWFAPLLEALRAGAIGMITVHAIGVDGTIDVETTRQDLRYFWRRRKPMPAYARARAT